MRGLFSRSFHRKLLAGFLLTGVVPLLLCTALLLNIFWAALQNNAAQTAQTQLQNATAQLLERLQSCEQAVQGLRENRLIHNALDPANAAASQHIYYAMYGETDPLRGKADFSIYNSAGTLLYSTQSGGTAAALPTGWGLLRAASMQPQTVVRRAPAGEQGLRIAGAIREEDTVLGFVTATLRPAHFDSLLGDVCGPADELLLLDRFWSSVYSTRAGRGEELAPALRSLLLAGEPLVDKTGAYSYYLHPQHAGLTLLLCQARPMASNAVSVLRLVASGCILLSMALCALFAWRISRQLFEPVRALNDAMRAVEQGDLTVRLQTGRVDEMGQLAGRFNRMVQRLQGHLQESLQRQRELNDAQIRMMQAQLDPHFICNTLDAMKWMGKINDLPELSTISADLADILRMSISGEEFVPLAQELLLLERYLEIQRIRFPNKFKVIVDVPDDLRRALVPKLMLQPLVENSIRHGLYDRESGEISVRARRSGESLCICVADNGCGMTAEQIASALDGGAPRAGQHLGLYNVAAILRLHYGQGSGLHLQSAPGEGVRIHITLPITEKEDLPC